MFILPRETEKIRQIEALFVILLRRHGFEEVLFPRAMSVDAWTSVASTLGGISEELQRELVLINSLGGKATALCHWQCEPFYLTLAKLGKGTPPRVFDRSGWSFRNEPYENDFRYRQFLRLEIVWLGPNVEVKQLFDALLKDSIFLLKNCGIDVLLQSRDEEVAESKQIRVLDLVLRRNNGEEIELVGAHQHGEVFVRKFWPDAPQGTETACMGVSLSRIGRFLVAKDDIGCTDAS